jgi:hypothetical protein
MADESQDIFGKIDAMLGKRAGFVGGAPQADDEFPLLTEVVPDAVAVVPEWNAPAPDAMASPAAVVPPATPERSAAGHLAEVDIDRLAAALEARLSELFIRQQLRIEALVRRVVREELDARRD